MSKAFLDSRRRDAFEDYNLDTETLTIRYGEQFLGAAIPNALYRLVQIEGAPIWDVKVIVHDFRSVNEITMEDSDSAGHRFFLRVMSDLMLEQVHRYFDLGDWFMIYVLPADPDAATIFTQRLNRVMHVGQLNYKLCGSMEQARDLIAEKVARK
jgi:hypothetical protein